MNAQRIKELDSIEQELSNNLVPASGKANTLGGEMLRAIQRLIYRYFNDGDVLTQGYGIETCLSSYLFLEDMLDSLGIISFTDSQGGVSWTKIECDPMGASYKETAFDYSDNDKYQDALYNLLALVIDFIQNDERAKNSNDYNSRVWRSEQVAETSRQCL